MRISSIAWAIQPGSAAGTRPYNLVNELIKLGSIDVSPNYIYHGKTAPTPNYTRESGIFPGLPAIDRLAVLSPVFQCRKHRPTWFDMYDDWSIAPDINRVRRLNAARTYANIRRQARAQQIDPSHIVTVNSRYMALKVGLDPSHVVPNGCAADLHQWINTGDDRFRLIVLGTFFSKRTDYSLLEALAELRWVDEIVVGSPGTDRAMLQCLGRMRQHMGENLRIFKWIDREMLSKFIGPRTAAVVPNVVSDYTLSQDLMKAYMFQAAGLKVICPLPLWPSSLSKEHAFLLTAGDSLQRNLKEWILQPGPDMVWRKEVTQAHSWHQRAKVVDDMLRSI